MIVAVTGVLRFDCFSSLREEKACLTFNTPAIKILAANAKNPATTIEPDEELA